MGTCQNSGVAAICQRAIELHQRGFTRGAIDVLEVELRTRPDEGYLWRLRGVLLHHAGRRREALHDMEQAQLLVALDHYARLVLADGLAEVGREELAADAYRLLAGDLDGPGVLFGRLHDGFAQLGLWRDAAFVCRRGLVHMPEDDVLIFALAQSLIRLKQPPAAVTPLLRRAVDLAPNVVAYRTALVLQLVAQGLCDEAYAELRQLPAGAARSICCSGCLRRLLALAIDAGDCDRAAAFAVALASENAPSADGRCCADR